MNGGGERGAGGHALNPQQRALCANGTAKEACAAELSREE